MLRKHEPVPKEAMRWQSSQHTICQVLRDIYFKTKDEDIKLKCRLATAMAKAMDKKLKEYNKDWREGFYDRRQLRSGNYPD